MATDTPDWTTTVAVAGDESKLLLTKTQAVVAGTVLVTIPGTAVKVSYAALLITAQHTTGNGFGFTCVGVEPKSTGAVPLPWFVAAFGVFPGVDEGLGRVVVPCSTVAGQQITLHLFTSVTTHSTLVIRVWGLTTNPGVQLRADGRAYPIGQFKTRGASGAAGTVGVAAAPGSTRRLLIQSLNMAAITTTCQVKIGTDTVLELPPSSTGVTVSKTFPGGLLLPHDTGITLVAAAADFHAADATYDIVI